MEDLIGDADSINQERRLRRAERREEKRIRREGN